MHTDSSPGPTAKGPLWIIALSLLAIAICLVIQEARILLHEEPPAAPTKPDVATLPREPGAEIRQRRSALMERRAENINRSHPSEAARTVNVERIVIEEQSPAPEEVLVAATVLNPVRTVQTNTASSGSDDTKEKSTIFGTVLLHGTPPPETLIDLQGNSYCGSAQDKPLTTRDFVVGTNGGLADVLVYIKEGAANNRFIGPYTTNELQFTNCQLEPYISAMAAGQRLVVRNSDATRHNFQLRPRGNPFIQNSLKSGDATRPLVLQKPEFFVRARCDLHPWEIAYVNVLSHPFFAVTDGEGRFAITNVPPGRYTLEAIHLKTHGTNGITRTQTIKAGQSATVDFIIEAPAN